VDPLNQYPEEDRVQQFLKGLKPAVRMLTELNTPRNWNEAWQQAKKVENALKRGTGATPFSPPVNQVNQVLLTQVAKMGEEMQALVTEVRVSKETCTKCNKRGHLAKDCYIKNPQPNREMTCYSCGGKGHWATDCPNKMKGTTTCGYCGRIGHTAEGCHRKNQTCFKCGKKGHYADNCPGGSSSGNGQSNNNGSRKSWNTRDNSRNQKTKWEPPKKNNDSGNRNAYHSQEQTLNTLAATVGELTKKVENLKF
jgi:hypothetical protein